MEALDKFLEHEVNCARDSAAEARGREHAYKSMRDHLASMCTECGEWFYSEDRLRDHQEIHHNALIS